MPEAAAYHLFLDLDGVLVDFDAGVLRVTGRPAGSLPDKVMWPLLARASGFYDKLPWMADGRALWDFCRPYAPIILTGLPLGTWAEPQKRAWCRRELGPEVPVITCLTRHKPQQAYEATPEGKIPVLVDDRLKIKEEWEGMGGVFILHQNAADSIAALQALGF